MAHSRPLKSALLTASGATGHPEYRRRLLMALSILALAEMTVSFVAAQSASTGAIAGTVMDPSGAIVRRASVTLRSNDTDQTRTTVTDDNGEYRLSFLQPGLYELTISATGFVPTVVHQVVVQITEVTRVPVTLTIAGRKERVVVTVPLLQVENATLGRVIEQQAITSLPLANRNYTQILGLTAGVSTDVVDATQLGAGSQEIRVNSARSGDNNFMINGVDANSYAANMTEAIFSGGLAIPAPDTIQEFKVQTALYDAQYGRGGGANVDLETKSGTAELHGTAYHFGRNEALNANNYFANATGVPRGEFRRQQPGGTLGGPLPWSKKRAFFFASYQATRDVNAASLASGVRSLSLPPIPLVRTPASLGAVFGGQTGLSGGVAVAADGSNINPVALNLLNARNRDGSFVIPSPQITSRDLNYTAIVPGRYDEDQFNTNLDLSLGKVDQLSVKFFFSNAAADVPFSGATVPGFPVLRSFKNRNLAVKETHVFSPNTLNEFRAGFSRITGNTSPESTLRNRDVGISRSGGGEGKILPQISVLGAFNLGNSFLDQLLTAGNNFYVSDTVSWLHGGHNLRSGAEIFRSQFNSISDTTSGSLTILSFPDFLLGLPAGQSSASGNGTSLSNIFATLAIAGIPHSGLRSTAAHFFAADDWRVSQNLTLNLGVRVEMNGQHSEVRGRQGNFDPEFYVPPPPGGFTNPNTSGFVLPDNYDGPVPVGFPRGNSTLLNKRVQVHPEPRVGFAWQPFSSGDLVLRGGYGIYANRISFGGFSTARTFVPPFTKTAFLSGGANAAASLQNPFPQLPPDSSFPNFIGTLLPAPPFTGNRTPSSPGLTDPNFKESTIQQYSLEVQHQRKSYLLSVAYVGAKGTHLTIARSNNQPRLASPDNPVNGLSTNSVSNADERVPFLGLSPLLMRVESSGTSSYNSLQATFKKQMSYGFAFLAAYTFAKSIDSAGDSVGSAILGFYGNPIFGEQVYNNQNDLAAQRGLSDFDRKHRLVVSYIWQLPRLSGKRKGLLGMVGDGWAMSGIVTLQSGLPFSILDSSAGTLFGPATLYTTGSLAPGAKLQDAILSGSVSGRVNEFFNTKAFVPAPVIPNGGLIEGQYPVSGGGGTAFGNLGRNILRGPDQRVVDLAMIKGTQLTGRANLVFRWEFFNVFNRPNFANPSANVSSPSTFGRINALSVNPRIMQYGVKLEF